MESLMHMNNCVVHSIFFLFLFSTIGLLKRKLFGDPKYFLTFFPFPLIYTKV